MKSWNFYRFFLSHFTTAVTHRLQISRQSKIRPSLVQNHQNILNKIPLDLHLVLIYSNNSSKHIAGEKILHKMNKKYQFSFQHFRSTNGYFSSILFQTMWKTLTSISIQITSNDFQNANRVNKDGYHIIQIPFIQLSRQTIVSIPSLHNTFPLRVQSTN